MKSRLGFVSNSSSSSFIVIAGDLESHAAGAIGEWCSYSFGETEFGWQEEYYHDVHSRVNFAFLQALSVNDEEWVQMIKDVIGEHTGAVVVDHGFTFGPYGIDNGYIDHQSCATGGENTEMFESKETLEQFLFGTGSYIRTDNDNH